MDELVEKIFGLEFHKAVYTLENMKTILNVLGNPQLSYKTIHITGSNGKGSTSNFISNILSQKFKVGLFTSPHYFKYNERFKINSKSIVDDKLKSIILELEAILKENNLTATFFEFTTALAFLYFKKENVDYAVIEVGLGGRLDATNLLEPKACVITNVSLEHTKILGKDVLSIAKEKAGIIKSDVFTAEKNEEVIKVFQEKGFEVSKIQGFEIISSDLEFQEFKYKNESFKIKMLGVHQIENACIAIDVCKYIKINLDEIKKGLLECKVKGRLEIISKDPLIILDGAHNKAGFETLIKFIQNKNINTLILGLSEDKDVKSIANILNNNFKNIILVKSSRKPMDPLLIKKYLKGEIAKGCDEALKMALQKKESILVAGSLYLLPEIEKLVVN